MSTKYDNADWFRLARTGGAIKVTLGPGGYDVANDGVSIPCKGCFVQARDGASGMWIDSNEEPTGDGPYIPGAVLGGQPIWIPVSDVAKLAFGGMVGDIADIVYLLG